MSIAHSVARTGFRVANRLLNPVGVVLAVPDFVHGSPAFTGAPTLSRRLWNFSYLFDKIENVEGDIVEAGVHWGYGILCFLHLTRKSERKIYAFDSFQGHSRPIRADKSGGGFVAMGSTFAVSQDAVMRTLEIGTELTRAEIQEKVQFRPGWMNTTMPEFSGECTAAGIKIAFVHLDPDLYEPCRDTLAAIWPHLSIGGIVLCGKMVNNDTAGKGQAVREHLATLSPGEFEVLDIEFLDTNGGTSTGTYLVKLS